LRKLVQDNRDKKKNTDSTAGFHQNQLESICVFYLLASFCPASFCFYISLHCLKKIAFQKLFEKNVIF
ncbi:hypothetical protein, partial [Streptococcus suis]